MLFKDSKGIQGGLMKASKSLKESKGLDND